MLTLSCRKWRLDPIGQILAESPLARNVVFDRLYFSRASKYDRQLASRERTGAMSKSEIQSLDCFIKSIHRRANGGLGDGFSWKEITSSATGPDRCNMLRKKLLTSKTRIRIRFLQEELLSLARHGGEFAMQFATNNLIRTL